MNEALDEGPFFHGTKAQLRPGDLLTAGFHSNYRPEIVMKHIYFTALRDGAGLAAELAAGFRAGDLVYNTFSYHFTPLPMCGRISLSKYSSAPGSTLPASTSGTPTRRANSIARC